MKKTIYEGWSGKDPYTSWRFSSFMTRLGAEHATAGRDTLVCHYNGVTIVRRDTGLQRSGYLTVGTCTVELVGDAGNVGEVERIILAEQERLSPKEAVRLGLEA